jgi:hypothetical protein
MSTPEGLERVESGAGFEVWQCRSSTLRLDWRRVSIVEMVVTGHGHGEFAQPCIRRWEEALRKVDRITMLSDFWAMAGYDSALRLALTEWSAEHRDRVEQIHMLTRSQLVSMGATVANLALGGLIKIHTLRTSYDLAVQKLGGPPRPGAAK